jgi:hypothetical protein
MQISDGDDPGRACYAAVRCIPERRRMLLRILNVTRVEQHIDERRKSNESKGMTKARVNRHVEYQRASGSRRSEDTAGREMNII